MSSVVTTFVTTELTADRAVSAKVIFTKASEFFKDEEFNVIDISDLVHHLSSEMFN